MCFLGVPLSLVSLNSILTARMENDEMFDINKVLDEIDHKWKFEPDVELFNCLLWQLAKTGNLEEFV
jgi:hypothetical protein